MNNNTDTILLCPLDKSFYTDKKVNDNIIKTIKNITEKPNYILVDSEEKKLDFPINIHMKTNCHNVFNVWKKEDNIQTVVYIKEKPIYITDIINSLPYMKKMYDSIKLGGNIFFLVNNKIVILKGYTNDNKNKEYIDFLMSIYSLFFEYDYTYTKKNIDYEKINQTVKISIKNIEKNKKELNSIKLYKEEKKDEDKINKNIIALACTSAHEKSTWSVPKIQKKIKDTVFDNIENPYYVSIDPVYKYQKDNDIKEHYKKGSNEYFDEQLKKGVKIKMVFFTKCSALTWLFPTLLNIKQLYDVLDDNGLIYLLFGLSDEYVSFDVYKNLDIHFSNVFYESMLLDIFNCFFEYDKNIQAHRKRKNTEELFNKKYNEFMNRIDKWNIRLLECIEELKMFSTPLVDHKNNKIQEIGYNIATFFNYLAKDRVGFMEVKQIEKTNELIVTPKITYDMVKYLLTEIYNKEEGLLRIKAVNIPLKEEDKDAIQKSIIKNVENKKLLKKDDENSIIDNEAVQLIWNYVYRSMNFVQYNTTVFSSNIETDNTIKKNIETDIYKLSSKYESIENVFNSILYLIITITDWLEVDLVKEEEINTVYKILVEEKYQTELKEDNNIDEEVKNTILSQIQIKNLDIDTRSIRLIIYILNWFIGKEENKDKNKDNRKEFDNIVSRFMYFSQDI